MQCPCNVQKHREHPHAISIVYRPNPCSRSLLSLPCFPLWNCSRTGLHLNLLHVLLKMFHGRCRRREIVESFATSALLSMPDGVKFVRMNSLLTFTLHEGNRPIGRLVHGCCLRQETHEQVVTNEYCGVGTQEGGGGG